MTTYEGIEKREFLRVPYNAQVEVKLYKKDLFNEMQNGMVRNVSSCGLLFETQECFSVGRFLLVTLDLNTLSNVVEVDNSVIEIEGRLLGRVVRVDEYQMNKEYGIGICFLRKSELDNEEDVRDMVKLLMDHS